MTKFRSKTSYTILFVVVIVGLYFLERYVDRSQVQITPDKDFKEQEVSLEFSDNFYPNALNGQIVTHRFYRLSYVESHEQAEWVAYELKKSHLSNNDFERPYFVVDNSVKGKSADWRSYKNSGYDRGHLCPAGDRRFDKEAFDETFFTSNISPQLPDFNGKTWNYLEQQVRRWAKSKDGVFVITGPVLSKGLPTIGRDRVSIPTHYFKIVIDHSEQLPRAIAFLIPHKENLGSYKPFQTTIDEIEAKTGLDFLPFLEDTQEAAIESERVDWF